MNLYSDTLYKRSIKINLPPCESVHIHKGSSKEYSSTIKYN